MARDFTAVVGPGFSRPWSRGDRLQPGFRRPWAGWRRPPRRSVPAA